MVCYHLIDTCAYKKGQYGNTQVDAGNNLIIFA